jgi:hypothetical protein
MNIGIDFNIKAMKASILVSKSNINDPDIFETKNVLVFSKGIIYAGNDGFVKYLTEKDAMIFDLDQIVDWNGLIINKSQLSVEKCLSILFSNLFDQIKTRAHNTAIDIVCIAIPYDKYYFWHSLIIRTLSLLGIKNVRILSQPSAFFSQPNINQWLPNERQTSSLHNQQMKKYGELLWYKKLFIKKPQKEVFGNGYLFVSISQGNTNVSMLDYGDEVLQVLNTLYTTTVTRKIIENALFDYFILEIRKDSQHFELRDPITQMRILETVKVFLDFPQTSAIYEISLPYILCEDGQYRTLDVTIDLTNLKNYLAPIFKKLIGTIKQLAIQIEKIQATYQSPTKIENIIFICDPFIQQNIKGLLPEYFGYLKVVFGRGDSLATGTVNFSRILTGENRGFLALEVIPFSVLVRIRGDEFVELIDKDTVLPTLAKRNFEIKGESKSKFVEIQLSTKEGDAFQSLNIWKIEMPATRCFTLTLDIDAGLKMSLDARSENGQMLSVIMGNTFSFGGAGLNLGIKGKDIRQYILNQFNYLAAVMDNMDFDIFEPNETFYAMLRDGEPFKALRYIGHYLKLRSLPAVEMVDSEYFEEQGIGGFISGSKISIPKYFTKDPQGFAYVLAHELAHYILIHEEQIILDDEQENEILTEIFVIFSGMGKLFLNGYKSKDIESSSLRAYGYLNENIIRYIHEIYFSKFNVNIADYRINLTDEAEKILDNLIRISK